MSNITKIVGILNITPDSFSDGGNFLKPQFALEHAKKLIDDGVDIIDIGAESTRPDAALSPITEEIEWQRLEQVLHLIIPLAKANNIPISIDTRNYYTAEKALKFEIDFINDVAGFGEIKMQKLLANYQTKIVVMHNLGVPPQKDVIMDPNVDVMSEINNWFTKKIIELEKNNIARNRIILDPGIGFGKSTNQNLEIIKNINKLKQHNCEIYVGHSRKSFLSAFTNLPFAMRDIETYAISDFLRMQKIDYIRVHDVVNHKRFFAVSSFFKE